MPAKAAEALKAGGAEWVDKGSVSQSWYVNGRKEPATGSSRADRGAAPFVALAAQCMCLLSGVVDVPEVDAQERRPLSVFIPMLDGVRLAADVWLPPEAGEHGSYPAIVEFSRYWRGVAGQAEPKEIVAEFNRYGFAYVIVDARGTGASFGSRATEYSIAEVRDFAPVIEWVVNQPWANGAVATTGSSYGGTAADLATIDAPVGLKASIPRFPDFDLYTFLLFPGGLTNIAVLRPWLDGLKALDMGVPIDTVPIWRNYSNLSVRLVDLDTDCSLLRQAEKDHAGNRYPLDAEPQGTFRNDLNEANDLRAAAYFLAAPYRFATNLRRNTIPSNYWASFSDAGTAAGAIARFESSTTPMRVIIGYWSHGAGHNAISGEERIGVPGPEPRLLYQSMIAYVQQVLAGGAEATQRLIIYFTAGENVWKTSSRWPPPNVAMRRFYLASHATLSPRPPVTNYGRDQYRVTFEAGSGATSRWNQLNDVHYSDRSRADRLLLTYTSKKLREDVEITGHPVVRLAMSSTEPDGAVITYLEDVSPDGSVTMLTEGELRLINRAISTKHPPYPVFGPYHTFRREDARPMIPGQVVSVEFAMLPLSVRVRRGHSLRVAFGGHDKDVFFRVPSSGTPIYEIYRDATTASEIDIPIVRSAVATSNDQRESPFLVPKELQ